jgi:hypothetical protein
LLLYEILANAKAVSIENDVAEQPLGMQLIDQSFRPRRDRTRRTPRTRSLAKAYAMLDVRTRWSVSISLSTLRSASNSLPEERVVLEVLVD